MTKIDMSTYMSWFEAAKTGNLEILNKYIEQGISLNISTADVRHNRQFGLKFGLYNNDWKYREFHA